ncbi:MAG: holin family protein [Paracoccus sp. (in: a-proteobacteria)]|uniref:holin family protein n=1 Tax=Paracoccus sp. TaxID=267 RepID=UPI0026E04D50|nr:holin family protein [Paracoccus sp. (in: a-proteobacteria)]MDO5614271.1 holin family protein [Paracoccus sp. (in: a-proteobacteria)]
MGMIDRFLNLGGTVTAAGNVAEIFRQNATRRMELDEDAYARAIDQLGLEFAHAPQTWFDSFVNGLNRLPRPGMTVGVLGLFTYAMVDPVGFSLRMEGLAEVPEPLWWLLGAIVSFYFGAREAHYFRNRVVLERSGRKARAQGTADASGAGMVAVHDPEGDAALDAALAAAMAAPADAVAPMMPVAAPVADPPAIPQGWRLPADAFADNAALRDWSASLRG